MYDLTKKTNSYGPDLVELAQIIQGHTGQGLTEITWNDGIGTGFSSQPGYNDCTGFIRPELFSVFNSDLVNDWTLTARAATINLKHGYGSTQPRVLLKFYTDLYNAVEEYYDNHFDSEADATGYFETIAVLELSEEQVILGWE